MNRMARALIGFVLTAHFGISTAQTGIMPVPQVDTAEIETTVEVIPASGGVPTQYIYRYTISNPITSSDGYYKISIDVSADVESFSFPPAPLFPTLNTLPKVGGAETVPLADEIELFAPFLTGYEGQGIVPIGLECPPGWNGGLRRNATVVCYTANETPKIEPGESLAGFAVHSRFPPMLREVDATAFWTVVVDDLEEGKATIDREAAFQVLENLRRPQITIGPGYRLPFAREHYVLFVRDLVDLKALGWIPNSTLSDEITDIVEDAGELFRTGQGSAAKLRLDDVVTAVNAATSADILPDAVTFLLTSVDSIQEFGRNTFPSGGLDTRLTFTPGYAELRVGEPYELEVFAFRLNNDDFRSGTVEAPDLNATVYFGCDPDAPVDPGVDPCPNVPLASNPFPNDLTPVPVDPNGLARLNYIGTRPGRDHIRLCIDSFCEGVLGRAIVDWTDPPDLVIEAFSPPLIFAETGETITFTDRTANIGTGSSAASETAFFVSDTEVFNPNTAVFVGSRSVIPLLPDAVDEQLTEQFELPSGFAMGEHFLFACADSNDVIAESNEDNNCSDVQLKGSAFFAVPVADYEDLFVVSINDTTVIEGDSGTVDAILDVTLSRQNPDSDITLDFEVDDGTATVADSDYIDTSGSITFAAGTGGVQTETVTVSVVGDTNAEDDETVAVRLIPTGGDAVYRPFIGTITIEDDDTGANSAPIAEDQTVDTDKDVPVSITLTATDTDSDPLTFAVVAPPAEGQLSGTPPNLVYTPNSGFVGSDSFTFKANDGTEDSNTASVTINVTDTGVCLITLTELVERDGSGQLPYSGTDQGKAGTGLRLTSMGRLYDAGNNPIRTVWRIRNVETFSQSVLLDAYNNPYDVTLTVPARTELFFASPVATGAATHRLFLGSTQVDVKAAGNQVFNDDTEVSDPQCVP